MSFRSKLYWLDRAFKGDKRPIRFAIAWLSVVAVLLAYYALTR